MLIFELFNNPLSFVFFAVALIVALSVHEFAHAFVADRLGDPTPRLRGRLTLNPVSHFDPFGTTMILLLGFGWGKPVPVNPAQLRHGSRGMAYVALAGPASNFILATVFALLIRFGVISPDYLIFTLSLIMVYLNLGLGLFNLLPFGPLDGYKIALGFLPAKATRGLIEMERSGQMIWFLVFAMFAFQPLYSAVVSAFMRLVAGF